ncbi:MAG: hypothetical protein ACM3QS_07280 [Bacteroidota bacterium]
MSIAKSPLSGFLLTVLVIAVLALLGPEEQSLGANVRVVYLHGAWVLTAEIAFLAAALAGLVGMVGRLARFHEWSAALGRAGLFFWVTYLPLSLWAMESNWNGLFLAEPRFRLAMTFAVVGLLLQAALWIMKTGWLTSLGNLVFLIVLRLAFSTASNLMHPPPSPIFNSGNNIIIGFFLLLNVCTWVAAFFLTRWFLGLERGSAGSVQQAGRPA